MHLSASLRILGGPQDKRLLQAPAQGCKAKTAKSHRLCLPPPASLWTHLRARAGSRRRSLNCPPGGRVLGTKSASILLQAEMRGGPKEVAPSAGRVG